ncbi:MAG: recombinase RecT [Desulfovibrio sp.]|nr:recombinase RecT [Desulfovibrio sp.]
MAQATVAALSKRQPPSAIDTVQALLTQNFRAIQSCLPKHLTPERMCRIAVQSLQRNPQILKCTPESLVKAIIEASSLGLEIDSRGLAYLVPYGNKNQDGRTNATLIFGYKGLMELAYRSGRVASIYAETVCENDDFEFELGLQPKLRHIPSLDDRGELRAVYAVAHMKDADPVFVVMGRSDVEKIRRASKAGNSGPWTQWTEEMWKKTAIRRLCKYLPLSPEIQKAIALDEQADEGVQNLAEGIINLPEEPAIETTAKQKEESDPEPRREEPSFECAKMDKDGNPKMVTSEDCFYCKDKDGCPNKG